MVTESIRLSYRVLVLLPQNEVQLLSSFFFLIAYLVFDLENREKLEEKNRFWFFKTLKTDLLLKEFVADFMRKGSFSAVQ